MDIREIVRDEMEDQEVTRYELAEVCGVSLNCIYSFFAGRTNIGSEKLGVILDHLGIKLQVP